MVDPAAITDEQAARAVQLFYQPEFGYVDATFTNEYRGLVISAVVRTYVSGDSEGSRVATAGKSFTATAVATASCAALATAVASTADCFASSSAPKLSSVLL